MPSWVIPVLTLIAASLAAGASGYAALTTRLDRRNEPRRENAAALHLALIDLTNATDRFNVRTADKDQQAELRDADKRVLHHSGFVADPEVKKLVERFRSEAVIFAADDDLSGRSALEQLNDREDAQKAALEAVERHWRSLS